MPDPKDSTRPVKWCHKPATYRDLGTGPIADVAFSAAEPEAASLVLLFAQGKRPCLRDIDRLLAADGQRLVSAQISHRADDGEGWVELLASGLTFDLASLAPCAPATTPGVEHSFGLPGGFDPIAHEGISLAAGPHIGAGRAMIPVVRAMVSLAAQLAKALGASAVCWKPAQSWMESGYFIKIADGWLAGGAFPALGLTGLVPTVDGGVESEGLAWFTGQELRVEAVPGEPPAYAAKLAARMMDRLVRHGPVEKREALTGPDGEALLAEPSHDHRHVMLWRDQ